MREKETQPIEEKRFECRDCTFPLIKEPPPPDCPMCGGDMVSISFYLVE